MKKLLAKITKVIWGVIIILLFFSVDVQAEETIVTPPEYTDPDEIQVVNAETVPKTDMFLDVETPGYYFTKKSAGKYIPVNSSVSGTIFWRSEKVDLVDEKKNEIDGGGLYTDAYPYAIFNVKKNKTYYVYVPTDISVGTIYMFVYPDNVKNIKMNTTYFQTGTGKNTYKYFTLKKMSLIDVRVIHASFKGKNTTYYLQKKVKGKWKTVTEKHSVIADEHAEVTYYRAPYGLSRGKYRLVTKTVKNGKYWVYLETKKV